MEMKMSDYQLPKEITFNFEEMKTELSEKTKHYETLVYSDEQIKEAKTDKANLNKLKKALNDERIRLEKEYMTPFNKFKSQVNEIIAIIDKPIKAIDIQVKNYEEEKRQEKKKEIEELFNTMEKPVWLKLEMIYDEKWLNASVSIKTVQGAITSVLEKIEKDIATLSNLAEFGFESIELYKSSLDMNKALNEANRLKEIQRKKAEVEAQRKELEEQEKAKAEMEVQKPTNDEEVVEEIQQNLQEETVIPNQRWIKFQALMTVDQAKELRQFFNERNIEFKSV